MLMKASVKFFVNSKTIRNESVFSARFNFCKIRYNRTLSNCCLHENIRSSVRSKSDYKSTPDIWKLLHAEECTVQTG